MNIKLILLVAFTLTALTLNSTPSNESPDTFVFSPVLQNEIEVVINDDAHTLGDTYTIRVYHMGILRASQTTNSLSTIVSVPNILGNNLVIEVEKHINLQGITRGTFQLIATEVRQPGGPTIINLIQL